MIKKVDQYMFKGTIIPLIITLAISALLLLLEKMLSLFDFVINQGGPIDVVWRMLGNLMPQYLTLVIPLSMFLGVLLAIRKLSLNSELDALLSSGMSISRLIVPSIVIAVGLIIVNLIVVGFVQPHSRYAYQGLQFEVRSGALGASIKANQFTDLGSGLTLRIEESIDNGRELRDIFAQKENDQGEIISISAKKGQFFVSPDEQFLILRLFNGTLIQLTPSENRPRVLSFNMHDLPINVPDFETFRDRGAEAKEMTFFELWDNRDSGRADVTATLHSRLARALSIIIVPFLAAALGLVTKRTSKALGMATGIVILLIYHKLLEFGLAFSQTGDASPYTVIWLPTLIFISLTAQLYYVGIFKVGGVPLLYLERIADIIGSTFHAVYKYFSREAKS